MAHSDIAGDAPLGALFVNIPALCGRLRIIEVTVSRGGTGRVEVAEHLVLRDQVAVVVNQLDVNVRLKRQTGLISLGLFIHEVGDQRDAALFGSAAAE